MESIWGPCLWSVVVAVEGAVQLRGSSMVPVRVAGALLRNIGLSFWVAGATSDRVALSQICTLAVGLITRCCQVQIAVDC